MVNSFRETELRDINPIQIRKYAEAMGWTLKPIKKENFIILEHPTKKLHQIILPTAIVKDKNLNLLGDALETLAKDENRTAQQLASDLLFPADVLRVHATNKEFIAGTGSFLASLQLLQVVQVLLETTTDFVYRQNSLRGFCATPLDLLQTCRVGPAEAGRFGTTIYIPISPLPQNGHTSEETLASVDVARRVTFALMKGLDELRQFLNEGIFKADSPEAFYLSSLGAVIATLPFDDPNTQIDISIRWSPNRPKVSETLPATVSFVQSEFPHLQGLAHSFRNPTPLQRLRIVGQVIELRSETSNPLMPTQGTILIQTLLGDEKAEIEVFLKGEEYRKACDAHRDRIPVSVAGVIEKKTSSNLYELREMKDFQVLSTLL